MIAPDTSAGWSEPSTRPSTPPDTAALTAAPIWSPAGPYDVGTEAADPLLVPGAGVERLCVEPAGGVVGRPAGQQPVGQLISHGKPFRCQRRDQDRHINRSRPRVTGEMQHAHATAVLVDGPGPDRHPGHGRVDHPRAAAVEALTIVCRRMGTSTPGPSATRSVSSVASASIIHTSRLCCRTSYR